MILRSPPLITRKRRRNLFTLFLLIICVGFCIVVYSSYVLLVSIEGSSILPSIRTTSGYVMSPLQPGTKIFILAGQSNMAGRGGIIQKGSNVRKVWDPAQLSEKEKSLTEKDENVIRLTANNQWIPAVEPLHQDIDYNKSCGIGPGLIFARNIGGPVGLIPCAVGGTKISQWSQTSGLYQNMITRARGYKIEALLWYQGESDCNTIEDAEIYYEKLRAFVFQVRKDLNNPKLLLLIVAIWATSTETLPHRDIVRNAIFKVGQEEDRVIVVDAAALGEEETTFLDDRLHLSSDSQFHLAKKLANAYRQSFL